MTSKPIGSLKDRIAKLNLQGESGSSAPAGPSRADLSTGAKGRISDKINKYQENAEDGPLIPIHGSFALSGARRVPSGSPVPAERARVTSLGGGRAAVPLGVIKARSVSSSGTPSVGGSEAGGSPLGSPGLGAPVGDQREGVTLAVSPALERLGSSGGHGATTPGSVSSMQVETGSTTSGQTSELGSEPARSKSGDSPLSSPIIDAVAIDLVVPPTLDISPTSTSNSHPLRGPLDSLRAPPPKFGSSTSLSSMAVETGSTVAPEDVHTPTAEEFAQLPSTVGSDDDEEEQEVLKSETEEEEHEREARTERELNNYEHETTDKTCSPELVLPPAPVQAEVIAAAEVPEEEDIPDPAESPVAGRHAFVPPLPADEALPEATLPAHDIDADDGGKTPEPPVFRAPPSPTNEEADVSSIKCGDCGKSVSLVDLAEHICAAQSQPPSLMSSPVISPSARSPGHSPARMSRSRSALSELSDLGVADSPRVNMAPPLSRSSSAKLGFSAAPPALPKAFKFDQFVAQTVEIAPADVEEDQDDHFTSGVVPSPTVGAYPADLPTDDHFGSPTAPSFPAGVRSHSASDLPQDIDEDDNFGEQDNSTFQAARQVLLDAGKRRASSVIRSPVPSPGVSRSVSVYSSTSMGSAGSGTFGKTMPGGKANLYDSDDEDEGYEGGSVTIVRSTASHRVAS